MPFQSEKQRKYLYSQKPEVAKKFSSHSKNSAYAKALREGNQSPAGRKKTGTGGTVGGAA